MARSDGYSESVKSAQEDMRDAAMAQAFNSYEPPNDLSNGGYYPSRAVEDGRVSSDVYGPVASFDSTAEASFGGGRIRIGQSGRTVFISDSSSSALTYSSGSANDVGGLEALDSQAAGSSPKYLGRDGGIYDTPQAPVVVTGKRMTAEEATAYDAQQYGSIKPIGPVDAFFTFTGLGRTLSGMGTGVSNMAHGAVTLGKQTILTASDAIGVGLYGLNNVLGGRHVDYPLDSSLAKSLETRGFGPTALDAVGAAAYGAVGPVLDPFRAAYLRDPTAFGESLPGVAVAAAPLMRSGRMATALGNTEIAGTSAAGGAGEVPSMGWPGKGGSGPAPGTIGITDSTSTKALQNYNPSGGGVEFVYDPTTNTFVAGKPAKRLFNGSPHEQLAQTFGSADNPSLVGGTFQRGPNGEFLTTENSGHYGTNWNDGVRSQFSQWLSDQLGLPVVHQTWNGGF